MPSHRYSPSSPTAGLTCHCSFESTSSEGGFGCWGWSGLAGLGASTIDRVHVDHLLGDIHSYPGDHSTCNLRHRASPLQLQIDFQHTVNPGASTPAMDWGSPFLFAQPDPLRHAAKGPPFRSGLLATRRNAPVISNGGPHKMHRARSLKAPLRGQPRPSGTRYISP